MFYLLVILFTLIFLKLSFRLHRKKRFLKCSLYDIDKLSGRDFEYFLYYFFRKHKIKTKITPYTHDFGADLIIKYRGDKIVVQAKRWKDNVGIQAVQETIGAVAYYNCDRGIVITNSHYTLSAYELAKKSNVMLIDRKGLTLMLNNDTPLLHSSDFKKLYKEDKQNNRLPCCPICNGQLQVRSGPYGKFYGCNNYPNCKYTKNII